MAYTAESIAAAIERAIGLILEDEESTTHYAAEGEEAGAAAYSKRAHEDVATLRRLMTELPQAELWREKYNALRESTQANAEQWEREKAGYETEVGQYMRPWHMVLVSDIEFSIGDRVRVTRIPGATAEV